MTPNVAVCGEDESVSTQSNGRDGPSGGAFSDLIKAELRHLGLAAERRLANKLGEEELMRIISGVQPTKHEIRIISDCLDIPVESLARTAAIRDAMVDRAMSELWMALHDLPDAASKRRAAMMIESFADRLVEAGNGAATVRSAVDALRVVGGADDHGRS